MKTKQDFPSINERPPEGVRVDGTKIRVLIVDDSIFVAKQLGQILTSEGYEIVATAVDGKDGVDKYKELCPNVDLVTMDITMPVLNGVESLKKIIADFPDAKVIMVSAAGQHHNMIEAVQNGAKEFIAKPFEVNDIKNAINSVLNS